MIVIQIIHGGVAEMPVNTGKIRCFVGVRFPSAALKIPLDTGIFGVRVNESFK